MAYLKNGSAQGTLEVYFQGSKINTLARNQLTSNISGDYQLKFISNLAETLELKSAYIWDSGSKRVADFIVHPDGNGATLDSFIVPTGTSTFTIYTSAGPRPVVPTTATITFTGSRSTANMVENDGMGGITVTPLPTTVDIGVTREFIITADAGYQFVNGGSYNGTPITDIYADNTKAKFTTQVNEDINIVMNATLIPLPTTYDITFTGEHCTAGVKQSDGMGYTNTIQLPYGIPTPVPTDSNLINTFTITADSGYEFNDSGMLGTTPITNISSDKTTATLNHNIIGDMTLYMRSDIKPPTEAVVRFNGLNVSVSSQSSDGMGSIVTTHYPAGVDVTVTLGVEHRFTLTADLGYEFNGEGTYNGIPITNITPDKSKAYFTVTITENIVIEMNAIKSTVDVTGFNRIYQLTPNELSDFATQRFLTDTEQDLGVFIINVLKLPFKVPPTYSGERETIKLGNYSVDTIAEKLKSDELEVDAGTVTVDNTYNNSYDYLDTEAMLHLPYGNSIKLDLNYVIDCDISIKYYLDVYTGATTINITSSKVGEVIQSNSVTIGTSIPFITYMNETQNKLEKNYINNKLTQAYIEISRNQQQNTDNPYQDVISTQGVLTDELGFIRVEDIQLVTTASTQEIDMIRTQLREGVIING